MTKQDILEYFKDINHAYNDCTRYDTLKRMLDELQEPCEDVPDNNVGEMDCISRQAVLSHIRTERGNGHEQPFDYVEADVIRQLPPVTPTEKVGQWEWNQYDSNPKIGNLHCSQCHGIGKSYYDYCPYCRAKMGGTQHEY